MSEIITLGEPLIVYVAEAPGTFSEVETYTRGLAGAELNFSIGVTRLGHQISYMTRLGKDVYGKYIMDFVLREGIDPAQIIWDEEHVTGSYLKFKALKGDPEIAYFRKGSAASHICPEDVEKIDFSNTKWLHITGISAGISESCQKACEKAMEKARANGVYISFDTNIRKALWKSEEQMRNVLNRLAEKCDLILPGIEEGKILTGYDEPEHIAEFYFNKGVKAAVIKLGARGAWYKTKNDQGFVEGFPVEHVVDTVGAGDAFAAGVVSGLLEGLTMEKAVLRGNAMGAIIITSKGDNDILPVKGELERFMKDAR